MCHMTSIFTSTPYFCHQSLVSIYIPLPFALNLFLLLLTLPCFLFIFYFFNALTSTSDNWDPVSGGFDFSLLILNESNNNT